MGAIRGKRKRVVKITIKGPKTKSEVLALKRALTKLAKTHGAKVSGKPKAKKARRRRKPR